MSATIKRVGTGSWQGNGFGYAAATYGLFVGDVQVATIAQGVSGDSHSWSVRTGTSLEEKGSRTARYGPRVSPTPWMTYREARAWALAHAAELANSIKGRPLIELDLEA